MTKHELEYIETPALIASDRVEGTTVFNTDGEKIGRIKNFMVDKMTGQVEYAVMSFGGFLGMGADHYPLPWKKLNYDPQQHGFVVDISQEQLDNAPKHTGEIYPLYDPVYGLLINTYYGMGR